MKIALIAAMDRQRAIGFDNQLPWHLPDDLKFFKAQTQGGVVVMGRKTFESLGSRPLPNRRNIVLTHQQGWQHEGVEVAQNWSTLKAQLIEQAVDTLWVIGGGEIYAACIADASELVLTQVDVVLEQVDTWFPLWDDQQWQVVHSQRHERDARHDYAFEWKTLIKKES
ncbi:MAG: dihydrofolate reductase [Thiotrichales bacterium]|jgi:dihydrofolate reductase|nr:dihydrofolate reductase [Thiotrichales bacterium]